MHPFCHLRSGFTCGFTVSPPFTSSTYTSTVNNQYSTAPIATWYWYSQHRRDRRCTLGRRIVRRLLPLRASSCQSIGAPGMSPPILACRCSALQNSIGRNPHTGYEWQAVRSGVDYKTADAIRVRLLSSTLSLPVQADKPISLAT